MKNKDFLICVNSFTSLDFKHSFNVGDKLQISLITKWITLRDINNEYFYIKENELYQYFETLSEHRIRIIEDLI